MGGFFLLRRKSNEAAAEKLRQLRNAFAETGFAEPEVVLDEAFIFAAYPKFQATAPELKRYPNGDFVFVCGTCLSERGAGAAAATALYEAEEIQTALDNLVGHYVIVLKKNGKTQIIADQFGAYHVYYDIAAGIVSSSFYAICSMLESLTLVSQAAFEYVFNGVVSGNETLFAEVMLLPVQSRLAVTAEIMQLHRPQRRPPSAMTTETRDEAIERSIALLDRYFGLAINLFGSRAGSALSGGYDSRLMLAFLRRHGAEPRLYVYGREFESDVRHARRIAEGEGLSLSVIDKTAGPLTPPAEFVETAHRNFLTLDGYGYGGIFDNGVEVEESARRVAGNAIAFNGGGGEIFRNFFYLPDRPFTIREILWTFYSQFDPAAGTCVFNIEEYYQNMERKALDLIGGGSTLLQRPVIEWLYHNFRCRAWDGKVDSIANRFGHTAMPFLENRVTEHASTLPLRWKSHGAYEAELIERIDARLAAYPSNYGHTFLGPPPLQRRIRDYATYLRPPWLRRYTHRIKYRARRPLEWTGYLAAPYRDAVLPGGPDIVNRLFRLDFVAHPHQYARILSLEYALRQFGGRVQLDF